MQPKPNRPGRARPSYRTWNGPGPATKKDQSVCILLRSLIGLDIGVIYALSTRDQKVLCVRLGYFIQALLPKCLAQGSEFCGVTTPIFEDSRRFIACPQDIIRFGVQFAGGSRPTPSQLPTPSKNVTSTELKLSRSRDMACVL